MNKQTSMWAQIISKHNIIIKCLRNYSYGYIEIVTLINYQNLSIKAKHIKDLFMRQWPKIIGQMTNSQSSEIDHCLHCTHSQKSINIKLSECLGAQTLIITVSAMFV